MADAGKRIRQFRIRTQSLALGGTDGDLPSQMAARMVALLVFILDLRFGMGNARGITVSMRVGHPGRVKAEGKSLAELLQGYLSCAEVIAASVGSETVGGQRADDEGGPRQG